MIGMDMGGTSIKFGLFTSDGELIHKWSIPTNIDNNGSAILDDSWNSMKSKLSEMNISTDKALGIGVGIPGYVDSQTGVVHEAINIGWKE